MSRHAVIDVGQNRRFTLHRARLLASAIVRTTRRPRLLPALALLALSLVAGACAGDGELGGPTIGGTPAATVGDTTVSSSDLAAEVEEWAANPAMLQAIGVPDIGSEGRRASALVSFVLSHRIVSEQARTMLADARDLAADNEVDLAAAGVSGEALADPDDGEIDGIIAQLDQQFTGPDGQRIFGEYPDDFRRRLATDLAFQERLPFPLQLGVEAPEVSVNPKFGTTEVLQGGIVQVVGPVGPRPAPLTGA